MIRHGQTEYNKLGVMQGSGVDTSLDETGLTQAAAFYDAYKDFPFDKIYTSQLQRSIQTVQSFIDLGIPHEQLEGLNEIHWGLIEGKPFSDESHAHYLEVVASWNKGEIEKCTEGGESPYQVRHRQVKALDYILKQENEEKILICMHGRAMRIFLCHMLNYKLRCMDIFDHANLGLYQLTYTGNFFTLDSFNNQDHLKGLEF